MKYGWIPFALVELLVAIMSYTLAVSASDPGTAFVFAGIGTAGLCACVYMIVESNR